MDILRGMLFGLIGGLIIAITGAWKDTLFERFEVRKFIRSPIIAMIVGIIIVCIYPELPNLALLASSVGLERLVEEVWKGIIRKSPSKFKRNNRDTSWMRERLTKK